MSRFLRVRPGAPGADQASDVAWRCGAVAIGEGGDVGGAYLDIGFADDAALEQCVTALDGHDVVVVEDDEAWWDGWRAFAEPVRCGRVLVVPAWLEPAPDDPPPTDADGAVLVVRLDPERSFGSGAHVTTQLALELLQGDDLTGRSVLDVGCGSGVLALAALALGAARAVGVDVDPNARAATARNAARNEMVERLVVLDALSSALTADVVVANVPTPELVDIAPEVAVRIGRGGWLVVTGFVAEREGAVRAAFAPLVVSRRIERDGWVGLVLRAR